MIFFTAALTDKFHISSWLSGIDSLQIISESETGSVSKEVFVDHIGMAFTNRVEQFFDDGVYQEFIQKLLSNNDFKSKFKIHKSQLTEKFINDSLVPLCNNPKWSFINKLLTLKKIETDDINTLSGKWILMGTDSYALALSLLQAKLGKEKFKSLQAIDLFNELEKQYTYMLDPEKLKLEMDAYKTHPHYDDTDRQFKINRISCTNITVYAIKEEYQFQQFVSHIENNKLFFMKL